jgi:hypothetical protein
VFIQILEPWWAIDKEQRDIKMAKRISKTPGIENRNDICRIDRNGKIVDGLEGKSRGWEIRRNSERLIQ